MSAQALFRILHFYHNFSNVKSKVLNECYLPKHWIHIQYFEILRIIRLYLFISSIRIICDVGNLLVIFSKAR